MLTLQSEVLNIIERFAQSPVEALELVETSINYHHKVLNVVGSEIIRQLSGAVVECNNGLDLDATKIAAQALTNFVTSL